MEKTNFVNSDKTVYEVIRAILIGIVIGGILVYILGIYKTSSVPCEKCDVPVKRETPKWHYVFHEGVCNRWFWACQKHNHWINQCKEGHEVPMCIPEIVELHRKKCGLPSIDAAIQAKREHESRIYRQKDGPDFSSDIPENR